MRYTVKYAKGKNHIAGLDEKVTTGPDSLDYALTACSALSKSARWCDGRSSDDLMTVLEGARFHGGRKGICLTCSRKAVAQLAAEKGCPNPWHSSAPARMTMDCPECPKEAEAETPAVAPVLMTCCDTRYESVSDSLNHECPKDEPADYRCVGFDVDGQGKPLDYAARPQHVAADTPLDYAARPQAVGVQAACGTDQCATHGGLTNFAADQRCKLGDELPAELQTAEVEGDGFGTLWEVDEPAAELPDSHVVATATVADPARRILQLPAAIAEQLPRLGRGMSVAYQISDPTAPHALLAGEGYVYRVPERGIFLSAVAWPTWVREGQRVDLIALRTNGLTRHLGIYLRP